MLLDTHAWVWWVNGSRELSRTAKGAIERSASGDGLFISSISAWEVALLVERARLQLALDVETWISRSESLSFVKFVPIDNRIAVLSTRLPGFRSKDPADRIIVATARTLDEPIVTKDACLRACSLVRTLW